jgi:hypothetical protein
MTQAPPGDTVPAPQPEAPAPPPFNGAGPAADRSGAGYMAGLQIVACACLGAVLFLPWLRWRLGASDFAYTQVRSLWSVVSESPGWPSAWMMLFVGGVALAAAGAVYELSRRPMGYPARTVSLAGFSVALGGAALGLVVGPDTLGAYDLPGLEARTTLEFGFWLGLGLAATGTAISVLLRRMAPNPPRHALQVAPQPVAPSVVAAQGPVSPDYMGHSHYPEHLGAGSPSIGPAVYPVPGFLTPAYPGAGHPGQPDPSGDGQEGTRVLPGRSAGQLVVMDSGRSSVMVVQPGQRLLVGRDDDCQIRVSDPSVSFRHATIERRGHEWVVQDVDAVNPTRIVDEWGTSRPVHGETSVASAELQVGGVRVTLYASRPEGG